MSADPSDPADDTNFVSCMQWAMPRLPEPPMVGAPPSFHDLVQAVGKGSPATSRKELPQLMVSVLVGFALLVLA